MAGAGWQRGVGARLSACRVVAMRVERLAPGLEPRQAPRDLGVGEKYGAVALPREERVGQQRGGAGGGVELVDDPEHAVNVEAVAGGGSAELGVAGEQDARVHEGGDEAEAVVGRCVGSCEFGSRRVGLGAGARPSYPFEDEPREGLGGRIGRSWRWARMKAGRALGPGSG